MATYINEPSHTFNEYLLIPGYSSCECIPANVSLKTPLVKFKKGEEPAIELAIPMVSAIMQAVSGERLAVELARNGGVSFIYGSQTPEDEAAMVARVKAKKAVRIQRFQSGSCEYAGGYPCAEGKDGAFYRGDYRGRYTEREIGGDRIEPRLPCEPYGPQREDCRFYDAS